MVREAVFLGQLEAFIEAARLGNISRAASSLFLTQPALTARLKTLERELGVTLLVRGRSGAQLTDAGAAFLPHAKRTLAAFAEGQVALAASTRSTTRDLSLGATPTVSTYVLPPVIKRFYDLYSDVHIGVHTAISEDLWPLVLGGRIQFAIGRPYAHPDVVSTPLYEEEFVLIVGSRHPLFAAKATTLAELAVSVLILSTLSVNYLELARTLRRLGLGLPTVIDADDSEACKRLVAEGVGVSLVPRTAVAAELRAGALRELPITDLPSMRRPFVLMRRRGDADTPAFKAFRRMLETRVVEMGLRQRAARARRVSGRTTVAGSS